MAVNMFLEIDGVKGEAVSAQGKDMIDIMSFSWGASMPITFGPNGAGKASGRGVVQDLTVTKYYDASTPTLFVKLMGGTHLKTVTLHCWKASGDADTPLEWLTVVMNEVLITSSSIGGSSGDIPIETLTLSFAKIDINYQKQGTTGSKEGGKVVGSWDMQLNKGK